MRLNTKMPAASTAGTTKSDTKHKTKIDMNSVIESVKAIAKLVVTRNFKRQEAHEPRFQTRLAHEPAECYVPKSSLVMGDVKFESTKGSEKFKAEEGFGCGTIAVGEPVENLTEAITAPLVRIEFNGRGFVEASDRGSLPVRYLKGAQLVVFNKNGMFAAL